MVCVSVLSLPPSLSLPPLSLALTLSEVVAYNTIYHIPARIYHTQASSVTSAQIM